MNSTLDYEEPNSSFFVLGFSDQVLSEKIQVSLIAGKERSNDAIPSVASRLTFHGDASERLLKELEEAIKNARLLSLIACSPSFVLKIVELASPAFHLALSYCDLTGLSLDRIGKLDISHCVSSSLFIVTQAPSRLTIHLPCCVEAIAGIIYDVRVLWVYLDDTWFSEVSRFVLSSRYSLLSIQDGWISAEELLAIALAASFQLVLGGCVFYGDEVIRRSASFSTLKYVDLDLSGDSRTALILICDTCPDILDLEIYRLTIDAGLASSLARLKNLKTITFVGCDVELDGPINPVLSVEEVSMFAATERQSSVLKNIFPNSAIYR